MRGLLLGLAVVVVAGCYAKERYVRVVGTVQTKAAMVTVDGIGRVPKLVLEANGLLITESTAPVRTLGSAVFITPTGTLLTCAHLFGSVEITTITVTTFDGIRLVAKLLAVDEGRDLALLRVQGRHDYARLGAARLRVGQEVVAVGNPHGLDFSTSHGIVGRLGRDLETGFYFTQVDAPINPGNSGGPLFNLDGELIGINARCMPAADGLGFAVAPEVINDFLNQFRGL